MGHTVPLCPVSESLRGGPWWLTAGRACSSRTHTPKVRAQLCRGLALVGAGSWRHLPVYTTGQQGSQDNWERGAQSEAGPWSPRLGQGPLGHHSHLASGSQGQAWGFPAHRSASAGLSWAQAGFNAGAAALRGLSWASGGHRARPRSVGYVFFLPTSGWPLAFLHNLVVCQNASFSGKSVCRVACPSWYWGSRP